MEIIQTIDVFVHFIYLHQYPVKKTADHWKFLRENNFFQDFMKTNYNAKCKKKNSPIVQPLAHPNTQKELQTKLF
jgi:hypothetical protein